MTAPAEVSLHGDVRDRSFTVTSDTELGFPGLHQVILAALFRDDVLIPRPDVSGPVPTRYRIKDTMHYRRGPGDEITVEEFASDAAALVRLEHVPRFRFLDIPGCRGFAAALLTELIPPELRHGAGTLGVHAFRSFGQVVDKPHQDGFEYGITYVLDRTAGGGESYLHACPAGGLVLSRQLGPGEILFFRDADFLHGATDIDGGHRDALVIQFDAPEDLQGAERDH